MTNPPRNISYRDLPPQQKNADGKWICRWCGKVCPGRRRSWCSDECLNAYWILRSPSYARHRTYERDKGVCAICGLDTNMVGSVLGYLQGSAKRGRDGKYYYIAPDWYGNSERRLWHGEWRQWLFDTLEITVGGHGHLWEADHIVPVAEGGGSCGLDNIRTLCVGCHKAETRKLHGRLKHKRKGQEILFESE